MKKVLSLVLAIALLATCAVSASAITIGFSQVGQESDWRTANTDDMCAAIEAEGWNLVYDDAQQKQENQVKALRNFITQGVDYILFTGVVTTGWDEVLKEVNEAEIPLFLLDRMPDCMDKIDYVAAFGGDFLEEGGGIEDEFFNEGEGIVRQAGEGADEAVAGGGIAGDGGTEDGGHGFLPGFPAVHLPHPGAQPDFIDVKFAANHFDCLRAGIDSSGTHLRYGCWGDFDLPRKFRSGNACCFDDMSNAVFHFHFVHLLSTYNIHAT